MAIDPEDAGRLQMDPRPEGYSFRFRVLCGACKSQDSHVETTPQHVAYRLGREGWSQWDAPFGWVCPACKAFLESVHGEK